MITELYIRTLSYINNASNAKGSLHLLKHQCLKKPKLNEEIQFYQELEELFTRYLIAEIIAESKSEPPDRETEHYEKIQTTVNYDPTKILCIFQEPDYRSTLLGGLSFHLPRLLQLAKLSYSNTEISTVIGISAFLKKSMITRSNLPPFSANHPNIENFCELQLLLTPQQFQCLYCACLVEQTLFSHIGHNNKLKCLTKTNSYSAPKSIQATILQEGINAAFIASLLGKDLQQDPLGLFIASIIRNISLFYIHHELTQYPNLSEIKPLQHAIQELTPRLDYWLAKDLNLPDDLLFTLRCRFTKQTQLPESTSTLLKAEHCDIALMLFNNKLLSLKELSKLFEDTKVSYLNLPHKLQVLVD